MIKYPNDLPQSEISLYISSFEQCEERIKAKNNQTTVNEIVSEVVGRMGFIVSDAERLRKFLLEEVKVPIQPVHIMKSEHLKDDKWWMLLEKSLEFHSEYWKRYYTYLTKKESWSLNAIMDIDDSTNELMNALADPRMNIKQSVKGLAFGYVQSGKTAHYLGLINKAADAGYTIIIVLAGIHNNLRSQTQMRLEEEVLGYKTGQDVQGDFEDSKNAIGVGIGKNNQITHHPQLQALTNRDEKGDFNNKVAGATMHPPLIVVTKKNATVLRGLIKYFKECPSAENDKNNKKYIPAKFSALIIDDEADQASVNTRDCYDENGNIRENYNPTTINRLIRELLGIFECHSYVGYTATPFANIFIPTHVESKKYGQDLFPKDFIVNIPRSENYIGALEFFGLKANEDEGITAMPLSRDIIKGTGYLGKGTKQSDPVGELPEELKMAIKEFVIAVAIRNLRGQKNKPNTMLIHIVRFVLQQNIIKKKVNNYFTEEISNYIKNGDLEIKKDLMEIWENDFVKTTKEMCEKFPKYMKGISDFEWNDIYQEIKRAICAKEFLVYSVNGKSDDALIYDRHKNEPFNVIVIGGDKLSRGLTLEGLVVSYFTRSSNTYDTLMQMGRWFGYRPGYLDLCRLFTTKTLNGYFVDISRATEDLVSQINYMCEMKQTPEMFGLGVESNPDLLITSKNKMRTGEEMKRDFSNHLSQTRMLDIDPVQYDENFSAVENLLLSIGQPADDETIKARCYKKVGQHKYWFDVSGYNIAQFLEDYKTSAYATRANSKYMSDYIKNQIKYEGLLSWTVCLINVDSSKWKTFDIGPITDIGAGIFRKIGDCTDGNTVCDLHTLTSLDHEYLDYSKEQMVKVNKLKETLSGEKKSEKIRKETRDRKNGLLILYPIGDVKPMTKPSVIGKHKTPFGIAVVFPDRKEQGDLKSYHINDIAVERKNDEFNA